MAPTDDKAANEAQNVLCGHSDGNAHLDLSLYYDYDLTLTLYE